MHVFLKQLISAIREFIPGIKKINYFSDGCAGQYKNCENFLWLCKHKELYNIEASWSFFATSHGKSPCDGIGGTMRKAAARESLCRPYENQILTAEDFYQFCTSNIKNIKSIFVENSIIKAARENFSKSADTLPGTRIFHHFIPLTESIIKCKHTSTDRNFSLIFNLTANQIVPMWQVNTYVLFVVGGKYFVGLITASSEKYLEAEITVLRQSQKKNIYVFEDIQVVYQVSFLHILSAVKPQQRKRGLYIMENKINQKIDRHLQVQDH